MTNSIDISERWSIAYATTQEEAPAVTNHHKSECRLQSKIRRKNSNT